MAAVAAVATPRESLSDGKEEEEQDGTTGGGGGGAEDAEAARELQREYREYGAGVPVGFAAIGDSGDPDRSAVLEAAWAAVSAAGPGGGQRADGSGEAGADSGPGEGASNSPPVSKRRGRGKRQRRRSPDRDEL